MQSIELCSDTQSINSVLDDAITDDSKKLSDIFPPPNNPKSFYELYSNLKEK
jgi:hypothetical protein